MAVHSLRNAPAAATVLARHLARGSGHVERLPQPWRTQPWRTQPWRTHPWQTQPWRNRAYDEALAALWAGDLLDAERLAAGAGPAGALLRRYVAGELGVLTGDARASSPRDRAPACSQARPGPGPVLHLVTNALPETVAGYTVRTQGIARAQRAAGRDVHVATRLGFPVSEATSTRPRRSRSTASRTIDCSPCASRCARTPRCARTSRRPRDSSSASGRRCCTRTATT